MTIRRAASAAALGLALSIPLTIPAHAETSPTAVDMWADFQTPAPWMDQKDNLHWYIQSPVITKQMVNRRATTQITSPATLDCSELGSGFVKDDAWTNVDVKVASCDANGAAVTYTVTKDMIGSRVFVNGWSATSTNPATVTGSVTIGRATSTAEVTAKRRDEPAPVAPGTVLGTWNGKEVSLASEAGVNQLWIAGEFVDAPAGNIVHSALEGDTVNIWVKNEASMDQWKLNLASREVTTQSVSMQGYPGEDPFVGQNAAGFVVKDMRGTLIMGMPNHFYFDWDGVQRTSYSGAFATRGFTESAVVIIGSYKVSGLYVEDIDGTVWPQDQYSGGIYSGFTFRDVTASASSVCYRVVGFLRDGSPIDRLCTVTKEANSCAA